MPWFVQLTNYIRSCGLPFSQKTGEEGKKVSAQSIQDIEAKKDRTILSKTGTLKCMCHYIHTFQTANYLNYEMPKHLRLVLLKQNLRSWKQWNI